MLLKQLFFLIFYLHIYIFSLDVRSIDGLEAARDLGSSGLTCVHVDVTKRYPAKDARMPLKVFKANVKSGSWFVSRKTLR